jgi:Ca2+-binding RTX toxin-like protein
MNPSERSIRRPLAVGAGLLVVAGLIVGATIAFADINCDGGPCYGDSGNNDFIGTNQHDHIYGYGGNDEWDANDDADTVEGGAGHDVGHAGQGADTVYGGDGDDDEGTTHAPYLAGGDGPDDIYGGEGQDDLLGGEDGDDMHGNNGSDTLRGTWGADTQGVDDLHCGDGFDHYSSLGDHVDNDCEQPLD